MLVPMTIPPTDEELMASYQAGDERAFDALFTRFASRLYGYFVRLTRDGAIADDLVQTTFLELRGRARSRRAGVRQQSRPRVGRRGSTDHRVREAPRPGEPARADAREDFEINARRLAGVA